MADAFGADPAATVHRLLAGGGDVVLPALTREELRALGDRPVLTDAEDERWWAALDPLSRGLVVETAQRGLLVRHLVEPDADAGVLRVADEVRVVLLARHAPSFVLALSTVPGELGDRAVDHAADATGAAAGASAATQVAVFGIDLRVDDRAAMLISVRLAGVYTHRLVTPARGLDALTEWLAGPPPAGQATVGRTVQAIVPAVGGAGGDADGAAPLRERRAIVVGTGTQWRLSEVDPSTGPGEPQPVDAGALRAWLLDAVAAPVA